MRLFDCFMYNNENLILELRLNTLDKFVHKFVIVESAVYFFDNTTSGLGCKKRGIENLDVLFVVLITWCTVEG